MEEQERIKVRKHARGKKSVRNRVKDKQCSQEGRGGGKRGAIKTTRWGMSDHACTDVSVLQREMRGKKMEKVQIFPQCNLDLLHSIHLGSIRHHCDSVVHFHAT